MLFLRVETHVMCIDRKSGAGGSFTFLSVQDRSLLVPCFCPPRPRTCLYPVNYKKSVLQIQFASESLKRKSTHNVLGSETVDGLS